MSSFLKNNLSLKIVSLLIAVSLWIYVQYTSTPQAAMTSKTQVKVPIKVEGLSENLVPLDMPAEITLQVKGTSENLSEIKPGHFNAYIDVAEKKAGFYNLPVKVETPPNIGVEKTEPETVEVRLDPLEKRVFTVQVKAQGIINPGFILQKMSCSPESVTLSGAKSTIEKVKTARAVSDIDGADMDVIQRIAVDIIDEDEKVIEHLKAEPAYVRSTITIRPEVTNASLPIHAQITGTPHSGYSIKKITVSPPTATVRYRYDLENIPITVDTAPISVNGLTGNLSKEVGLDPPEDISTVKPKLVKIHITIAPKN
ncbi:MAG: YbbR-like domain-containing protein [Vulcanimicrobiota bacterium]